MKKIVLTGAAGNLGGFLRKTLSGKAQSLVSTDLTEDIGNLFANETYVRADLADLGAVTELLKDADMVVHFGAIGDEAPFDAILQSNIIGTYNVWEAAHKNKVRRVVYASSIHAVGMYPKTEFIGTDVPHRPDSFYGIAKCFGEDLGRVYWEKNGVEAVCLRILSCTPKVNNARALGSWLSYDDLAHLVARSIDTPLTGFTIVYGVSNNDRTPVDNAAAHFLGYRPRDNAEDFAVEILADSPPMDPQNLGDMCHGGPFAVVPMGVAAAALLMKKP